MNKKRKLNLFNLLELVAIMLGIITMLYMSYEILWWVGVVCCVLVLGATYIVMEVLHEC